MNALICCQRFGLVLALIAALIPAGRCIGADVWAGSYEIGFSSSALLLVDIMDETYQNLAARQSGLGLSAREDCPSMRLTNLADDAAIVALTIDFGVKGPPNAWGLDDNDWSTEIFSDIQNPVLVRPAGWQPGETSRALTFSFHNEPLAPGESFAFWANIEAATGFANGLHDYQTSLWNPAGASVFENAVVQVQFEGELGLMTAHLFNFEAENRDDYAWGNTTGRSLAISNAASNGCCCGGNDNEKVAAYVLKQVVAPEPGGLVLLAVGALVLMATARSRAG